MNRLFCMMLITVSLPLLGDVDTQDWVSHFLMAETFYSEKNYVDAIKEYSNAIKYSEQLFLYNQRGRAYEMLKMNEQAFKDFDFVVNHPNVTNQDLIQGLWGRARMYLCFNDFDQCKLDFDRAKEIDSNFPRIESNEKVLVWKNVHPAYLNPQFKKKYISFLIDNGVCQCSEDVNFTENGVCIIKKHSRCKSKECCEEKSDISKDNPSSAIQPTTTKCTNWCDRVFVTAQVMCSRAIHNWCAALCVGVAEVCKQTCYECCAEGSFYEACVKPFETFLERVGCEPGID